MSKWQSITSTLSRTLTRSRWRVGTSARHTSLLYRWHWSWPAAGRSYMSSCQGNSPAPCRSSQISFCYHQTRGLYLGCLLHLYTLMGAERMMKKIGWWRKNQTMYRARINLWYLISLSNIRDEFTWCYISAGAFWRGKWGVEVVNRDSTICLTFNWSRARGQTNKGEKGTRWNEWQLCLTWCIMVYLVWGREGDLSFHSLCCKKRKKRAEFYWQESQNTQQPMKRLELLQYIIQPLPQRTFDAEFCHQMEPKPD